MKIALFFQERNHYPLIKQILNQFKDDEIYFYCKSNVIDLVQRENIIYKKYDILSLVLAKYKYNKIFIDEQYDANMFLLPFFLFSKTKTYLIIHNINSWFSPVYEVPVKYKVAAYFRKFISEQMNNFIVVSTKMKEIVIDANPNKNVFFIPFGLTKKEVEPFKNEKITLVIPGTVTQRRKYENIIQLLSDKEFSNKIKIVLLGRANDNYGHDVVKKMKALNAVTFTSFISEEEFSKYIKTADLIFSDVPETYTTDFYQKEIYGKTKATGITFLMLQYCKPGIISMNFEGMTEMNSQILKFDDYNTLKEIIFSIISDTNKLKTLVENAQGNYYNILSKVDTL